MNKKMKQWSNTARNRSMEDKTELIQETFNHSSSQPQNNIKF